MSWLNKIKASIKHRRRATPTIFATNAPADAAIERVQTAKRQVNAPAFPSFQSTAGDQLNTEARDPLSALRMKLRNSYTPSQPVTDWSLFAGRTEILRGLISAIEDRRLHSVIYGERGIGKTSILHVLTQSARRARYLVSYVSCGASSSFDEMFRAVAEDIPLLYHSAFGPTSAEAEKGATLASLLPATEVSVRQASDLCSKITGTRVLIILDEFDRAEDREFRLHVAEFLKNLSDRSVRVQLFIAGVASNLTELVEHIPSIQRNVFAMEIPPLTSEETRQLVKAGEAASSLTFEPAAIETIVPVSNGLPYLASLISHHAGLSAIEDGRTTVTRQDVANAVSAALVELEGRVSKRSRDQISACMRDGAYRYLGALAGAAQLSGGQFDKRSIESLAGDGDAAARTTALVEQLVESDLLIYARDTEEGRSYRFQEESVPSYLWLQAAAGALQEPRDGVVRPLGREAKSFRSANATH